MPSDYKSFLLTQRVMYVVTSQTLYHVAYTIDKIQLQQVGSKFPLGEARLSFYYVEGENISHFCKNK